MGEAKRKKQTGIYPVLSNVRQKSVITPHSKRHLAFEAADKGDLDTLKTLIRTRHEANWKHPDCCLLLLDKAVYRNDIDMLCFLLDQGANPNALIECDQLVPWPADVGDGMYFSPLASAIADGRFEILAALLTAGADLNLPIWISNRSGQYVTCRDTLNELPELNAAIETLILEQVSVKACSNSRAQRI